VVLVTTTFVARRDVTVIVATCFLKLWHKQRCKSSSFVQVIASDLDHAALAWTGRFHFNDSHD
jgi:hypothetical protein